MGVNTPLLLILTYIPHDKRATCEIKRWRHTLKAASQWSQCSLKGLLKADLLRMYGPVQIESTSLRVWWSRGVIKDPSGVIRELNLDTSTGPIRCPSKESRGRGYSPRLCSCLNAHGACCKTYSIWPLAPSLPLPFYPSTSSPLTLHMIWKAAYPHTLSFHLT